MFQNPANSIFLAYANLSFHTLVTCCNTTKHMPLFKRSLRSKKLPERTEHILNLNYLPCFARHYIACMPHYSFCGLVDVQWVCGCATGLFLLNLHVQLATHNATALFHQLFSVLTHFFGAIVPLPSKPHSSTPVSISPLASLGALESCICFLSRCSNWQVTVIGCRV